MQNLFSYGPYSPIRVPHGQKRQKFTKTGSGKKNTPNKGSKYSNDFFTFSCAVSIDKCDNFPSEISFCVLGSCQKVY